MFPFIAFGGMAGALAGPLMTSLLVARIGVPALLLVSATSVLIALGLLLAVTTGRTANDTSGGAAVGGSPLDGAKAAFAQPFLRYMAILMLLSDGIATLAYALMADYTKVHYPGIAARTAFYADLDLAINGFGALLQLTVTPLILRGLGTLWAMVLPTLVNFVLLALLAIYGPADIAVFGSVISLLTIVQIGTRGMTYGMTKPASDSLYTRMPRDARYKGKNFIETTVWRFGDLLVTTTLTALRGVGVGIAGLGLISAALCGVATIVARRAATSPDLLPESAAKDT
jgi:AAA family ATP:ADP antiporter